MNSQNIKVGDVVAIRGDRRLRSDGTRQYTADQLVQGKYVRDSGHKGVWTGVVTRVNASGALVGGAWRDFDHYEVIWSAISQPEGEV